MTTAMHDNDRQSLTNPVCANLRPGTLVYLWAPESTPRLDRPILARVERASVDNIVSIDLEPNPVPGQPPARRITPVGLDIAPGLRWTWEVAAPPQLPPVFDHIEVVEAEDDVVERTRLLAGEPGAKLRVTLINGEVVHGVLTRLFMGQCSWQAEWGELVDDGRNPGEVDIHSVRIEHVSKISRTRRA